MNTHRLTIITVSNGGAKSRRCRCACGYLGVRFAYGPGVGRTLEAASVKAQKEADEHAEGQS